MLRAETTDDIAIRVVVNRLRATVADGSPQPALSLLALDDPIWIGLVSSALTSLARGGGMRIVRIPSLRRPIG